MRRTEGGAKIFGYFVWKITILRQKIIFFPILGGGGGGGGGRRVRPPPWIRPCIYSTNRGKPTIYTVKPALKGTSIQQITVHIILTCI
jgi:hypothetical protein